MSPLARFLNVVSNVVASVLIVLIALVGWGEDRMYTGFFLLGVGVCLYLFGIVGLRARWRGDELPDLDALGWFEGVHARRRAEAMRHPWLLLTGGVLSLTVSAAAFLTA